MRQFRTSLLLVLLLVFVPLFGVAAARAQSAPEPVLPDTIVRDAGGRASVRSVRLSAPLKFDGRLDEPIYTSVHSFGGFVQQEPHHGEPATDDTEAWVLYDDKNVYVAVKLHETDKTKRVMSDMRRDSFNLYNNDHIAVTFDTFNDHRNGFGFSSNAQGGLYDWQTTNEQPSPNWNGLWEAKTAEFDGGWTVEFRIPFRSIRYREGGTVWGINFRRMVRSKNEISYLSPVPLSWGRRGLHKLSDAGPMVGLETPAKQRNVDLKPYALGSSTTNHRSTPRIVNDGNGEFGVDAKWGITQSIVTDFTYNTDFAQVEDDEAQVNLTRFSVLFPEKRDFFLEGQDVFNFTGVGGSGGGSGGGFGPQAIQSGSGGGGGNNVTPILFFSRRIGLQNNQVVPILGGARLIGRGGGYQVGALHMHSDDKAAASAVATDFSVLRINRDILSRSRIGMIATRRAPRAAGVGENYAYGIDTQINPRSELQMSAYWAGTSGASGASSASSARQQSYRGYFNWNADRTGFQIDHLFVGEDFNPEMGFLRRKAFRRTNSQARFSPRSASQHYVRKFYYEASLDYLADPRGALESREAQAAYRMELTSSDQFAFEYSQQFEGLDKAFAVTPGLSVRPGAYNFNQGRFLFTTSPQRPVSGTLILTHGGFYGGTFNEVSWRGRVEFGPQFQVEPTVSLNNFDTPFGKGDAHLMGGRLTYTLTPRMFVSALIQYQSSVDTVTTNARFRWEYQPGSELFVVYSDGRNTLTHGIPAIDNRSFVVKLTKLFRF
jgi:hypothetical protein